MNKQKSKKKSFIKKKTNGPQRGKRKGVFWETIAAAKTMVQNSSLKRKRSRHTQKKMPLKMLEGVRRKKSKRIKKEREQDLQAGTIYNSLHGRHMEHFAIQRISNVNKKRKLTRMDFGKTTGIIKAEQRNYEKTLQRREKRRGQQKMKNLKMRGSGKQQRAEGGKKAQKRGQGFKIEHKGQQKRKFGYKDGVLRINPNLIN